MTWIQVFWRTLWCVVSLAALQPQAYAGGQKADKKQQQTTEKSPIDRQIDALQEKKEQIQQEKHFDESMQHIRQEIIQGIEAVKQEIEGVQEEQQEFFLNMKLSELREAYQHINELEQTQRRMIGIIDEHMQLLQSIQKGKERQSDLPTAPGYDTLLNYSEKVHETKQEVETLQNNKKSLQSELSRRKDIYNNIVQRLQKTQQEKNLINQRTGAAEQQAGPEPELGEDLRKLSIPQQGEIIDLRLKKLKYEQKAAQTKVTEDNLKIDLITTKIEQAQSTLKQLEQAYEQIKKNLYISNEYIEQERARISKQRQELTDQLEKLNERLRGFISREEQLRRSVEETVNQNNISQQELDAYREWSKQPESAEEWRRVIEVGSRVVEKRYVQTQRQRIEAQIEQTQHKLQREDLGFEILQTWSRLSRADMRQESMHDIKDEIRRYQNHVTSLEADRNRLQEQRNNAITTTWRRLSASLESLKQLQTKFDEQGKKLLAQNMATNLSQKLQKAETELRRHIDVVSKLVEVYATTIATIDEMMAHLHDVIERLKTDYFWKRSDQSISVNDIFRFFSVAQQFIGELHTKLLQEVTDINITYYTTRLYALFQDTYQMIMLLLQIVALAAGYIILRRYLSVVAQACANYSSHLGFFDIILAFIATLFRFIRRHLLSIYLWFTLFILVLARYITFQKAVIFYLLSIPYGIYIVYTFFNYLARVNRERGYLFIGQDYQRRFFLIMSALSYITIVIMLFRQALWLGGYSDYQVLLALYYILLQISLVCLISREHVLSLVSGNTPMWQWIEEHLEKYYYAWLFVLITIIVMNNPFVGFGYQVFYYLIPALLTLVLIPLFSWLHDYIKRSMSDLFFYYSDGDMIRERFSGGKTWYGFFVVISFLVLALIGASIAAYMWGYPITLNTVWQILETGFYTTYDAKGQPIEVTIFSLLTVFLFVLGGIVCTYIVNRFVLQRIFDPLLIGAGVQNTIVTLTQYAILAIALLLGFHSANLIELGYYLIVLVFGLAYVMKEPIADFISYFIILVQRPVKIGDYIKIEPDISGVVRQINPRSTIVRYRNSTSHVIPNSKVITSPVKNWHYTKTFSAFEDIELTVPYDVDPDHVRNLVFQVLEEHTNVLRNPRPIVRLEAFGENGFEFRIRGFITADKIHDLFDIAAQVRLALVRRLRSEGISLAVPTRVLQVTSHMNQPSTQGPSNQASEHQADEGRH